MLILYKYTLKNLGTKELRLDIPENFGFILVKNFDFSFGLS